MVSLSSTFDGAEQPVHDDTVAVKQRLHHELIQAARAAVIEVQDQGQIDDDVLREIERERDLEVQHVF